MTPPPLPPTPDRPSDTGEPPELSRCTIYTRRDDAAEAFAAGLADGLTTVEAWQAAGILAGFGIAEATGGDVARQLAHYAAIWMQDEPMAVYRVGDAGTVWTGLRPPPEGWTEIEEAWDAEQVWTVPGAGLADTAAAARQLAEHAWVHQFDIRDLAKMPTVMLDRDSGPEAVQAAAVVRTHGVPASAIDTAYSILRALALPITWQGLSAAAAGATWRESADSAEVTEPPPESSA